MPIILNSLIGKDSMNLANPAKTGFIGLLQSFSSAWRE
jgi:hypothetical protein